MSEERVADAAVDADIGAVDSGFADCGKADRSRVLRAEESEPSHFDPFDSIPFPGETNTDPLEIRSACRRWTLHLNTTLCNDVGDVGAEMSSFY